MTIQLRSWKIDRKIIFYSLLLSRNAKNFLSTITRKSWLKKTTRFVRKISSKYFDYQVQFKKRFPMLFGRKCRNYQVVNNSRYVMRNTKLLSLTGQGLSEVPNSVLEDASEAMVTCIDLSRNKLREVPEKISTVRTVTNLKLTSNNLCIIGQWLGECLVHLSYLDLSQNLLTNLPTSLSNLQHLREINISFNR